MRKTKLQPGEDFLMVYHKHKITLLPKVLKALIVLILPWYFLYKYGLLTSNSVAGPIMLIWTFIIVAYLTHIYTLWRLNVYFVTTKRLVHIQHENVFKKFQVETPIERILNVSYKIPGASASMLHYGDVLVQVVGVNDPLILKKIPHPEDVKDFIWQTHLQHGNQKVTYTQPEIIPNDVNLPYSPRNLESTVEDDDKEDDNE